jgi:EAL domain-containing protein (putative c-di-GMP-specific phosphodiesterase class I)
VESIEILDICKELDIDYIQGYYCHKPTIIN